MVKFSVLEETAPPQHSCGLDFARKELEKHGWSEGKGLGKAESGRANAIKIGVKNNTLGVGFDVGKEFTNNWWDNLFNKAANNIVVEKSENGIQVSKKSTGSDITETRKLWKVKGKDLYCGRFVKANSGESSPFNSENPTVATTKFSDEELLKACGGRTAHKSARHGHKLSGKLKRVAEQDDKGHPEKPSRKRKKHSKEVIESTPDVIDGKHSPAQNLLSHGDRSENIPEQNSLEKETAQSKQSSVKQKFDTEEILWNTSQETSKVKEELDAVKSVKRKKRKKKRNKLVKKQKYAQDCEFVNGELCISDNEDKRCKNELQDVSDDISLLEDVNHKKTSVKTKKHKKKKKKME